jgi:hypothetical protein
MNGACQFSTVAYGFQHNLNKVTSPSSLQYEAVDFLNNSAHYLDGFPVDFAGSLTH